MQGSHNITLTSQNNSEYILPISGTLATTDDLLPNNSITTSHIINGTIQGIDIANNTLDDSKIAPDLSATKVTSGIINKSRLPNRDIVNINNLTTVLGGKLLKFDITNNLISTNVDKPLSANQGKVLKDLLDSKIQFTTNKQILGGVNLDFTANQSFLTKLMTLNTTFTASNLKQGNRILLELSGNFNIILPNYFQTLTGAYDGTKINILELEVINDSLTTPLVYVRIFN
jgi:small nuclear ribonucleoprotein (snRNP)-like protein